MNGEAHSYTGSLRNHVINCEGDYLIRSTSVSAMLSDHFLVNNEVSLGRPFFTARFVSYRNYWLIDINTFLLDLKDSQLVKDSLKNLNQLVDMYNCTLKGLI